MPRAALYLRLSESSDESASIGRQEADLRDLAEREGWAVAEVLVDEGISGRRARANADRAVRLLREGVVDVLAVWKFDRFSRQGLGALAALLDALDARPSARFVALRDGLSSDAQAWRIVASLLAEVARMEAENTSMRVSSSVAREHLDSSARRARSPKWRAEHARGVGSVRQTDWSHHDEQDQHSAEVGRHRSCVRAVRDHRAARRPHRRGAHVDSGTAASPDAEGRSELRPRRRHEERCWPPEVGQSQRPDTQAACIGAL